ncbi:HNH endonuclease signature motif containing protein [Lysobacter sp. GCM10012299]|uniref:HNH endonuclease signature motif containing protein n=1 Tax=Lysobacter sp. GCM10012299 TaxID=3317333 RepID=UPI00361A5BE9
MTVITHFRTGHPVDVERGIIYRKYIRKGLVPLAMTLNNSGYAVVPVGPKGGTTSVTVHRLVWEAANGVSVPTGQEIDHRNGIKADNRLSNLQLVTRAENASLAFGMARAKKEVARLCFRERLEIIKTEHLKTEWEWGEELDVSPWTVFLVRQYADVALTDKSEAQWYFKQRPDAKVSRRTH